MASLRHFTLEATPTSSESKQDFSSKPDSPTDIELDNMRLGEGAVYNGPIKPPPSVHTHTSITDITAPERPWRERNPSDITDVITNADLEMHSVSGLPPVEAAAMGQTIWNPTMNKWRVLSYGLMLFGNGLNDSAPGALLPYIEKYYKVNYTIVSLIFISNALGFISAAFFVRAIDHKFGRARTLMLCDALCIVAYVIMAVAPPFAVFALAFFPTGFAMAIMLALGNVFLLGLPGATTTQGLVQGLYGIGGIIGPLASAALGSRGILFSRFYAILIAVRAISLLLAGYTFHNLERDASQHTELLSAADRQQEQQQQQQPQNLAGFEEPIAAAVTAKENRMAEFKQAVRNRTTIIGALFIFAYQGAEVSISGWVISFLLNYRSGTPAKVGYVTTYFWAGITIGRLFLSPLAPIVGEKLFVYILTFLALTLQLLIWLLPSLISDIISIAFIGLVLGPIYPSAVTVFARLLPRRLQSTALAFVGGVGSSGGALAPFVVGIWSQRSGTWVLHPVAVALFGVMGVCWVGLPRERKRRE